MKTTIPVQNLKCGGCANTIRNRIGELEGVHEVEVDEMKAEVTLSYSEESVLLSIKKKLAALGYPEVDTQNDVLTKAKSFVSCAAGRLSK